jgi:hypothetical protein
MGHSDSRPRPPLGLWIPRGRYPRRMPRRASQVPRLTLRRAPPSTTPGGPAGACARFFPAGRRLHHPWKVGRRHLSVTRPNQVHLRWGSRLRCRGRTAPPRLFFTARETGLTPRVWLPSAGGRNYMVNEQLPWLKPFIQQDQPGLAWRVQRAQREEWDADERGATRISGDSGRARREPRALCRGENGLARSPLRHVHRDLRLLPTLSPLAYLAVLARESSHAKVGGTKKRRYASTAFTVLRAGWFGGCGRRRPRTRDLRRGRRREISPDR